MIRCDLSILLAERNLKISRVAHDTKISRTTLTALTSNKSQGIQLSTLNTLCSYLKVTPDKILSYYPMNFLLTHSLEKENSYEWCAGIVVTWTIYIDVYEDGRKFPQTFELTAEAEFSPEMDVDMYNETMEEYEDVNVSIYSSFEFLKIIKEMPIQFLNDLKTKIKYELVDKYAEKHSINNYVCKIEFLESPKKGS